jgi:hypothetical protein
MAPPVDMVGPCPRLGDVEAPPRSRSSLSSVAMVESEPLCHTRILGVQNPGANINTRYAGTKSHTYDV